MALRRLKVFKESDTKMKNYIIVNLTGYLKGKAKLIKGRLFNTEPKTYKKLGVCGHDVGNRYNSTTLTVYSACDGSYRYEIYRDGCFYPYYGRLELINNN